MRASTAITRRGFAVAGAAATMALLSGCTVARSSPPTSPAVPATGATASPAPSDPGAAPSDAPSRIGYCMVLSQGTWTGPRTSTGQPSFDLLDALTEQRSGAATPQYLRVTSAASSGEDVPAEHSAELAALQRLRSAGIRLGVAIATAPQANPIAAADVIAHAKQVKAACDRLGGLYDWIFLDQAVQHTSAGPGGSNDLQQIVDGVAAAGWSRIMINASGFVGRTFDDLPERTWAMARHFGLITASSTAAVAEVVSSGHGALQRGDDEFVQWVREHRPGSTPVLKLEVPSQSVRFQALSEHDQSTLLRLWAQAQPQLGCRVIYPLFLPGQHPNGNTATEYDSLDVGTFWEQRQLMEQYG